MRNRRLTILATILGCFVATAAPGQTLSSDTINSPQLDGEQLRQVAEHVSRYAERLASNDVSDRREGRRGLLVPIQDLSASRAFRKAYSDELMPALSEMARGDDLGRAVSALAVMGWIGSDDALDGLLTGLRSDLPALRYAAADGLSQALAFGDTAMITGSKRNQTISRLTMAVPDEANPFIVRSMVNAIRVAATEREMVELCKALGKRVTPPMSEDGLIAEAHIFIVDAMQETVVDLRNNLINPEQFNEELGRASVELGGRLLVWTQMVHDVDPELAEERLEPLLEPVEVMMLLAHAELGGDEISEQVGAIIARENWRGFDEFVLQWVGKDGWITNRPYAFKDDYFTGGTPLAGR
jgi:hypothetical protein